MPSKRPAYRADRPHCEFLTEIATQLPAARRTPAHFAHAMRSQLEMQFQVDMQSSDGDVAVQDSGCVESMPVIDNADFQHLHASLKALNPEFVPRTFFIDDLPSAPAE